MPRRSRIDAAGALHHVMVRGIERGAVFRFQNRFKFILCQEDIYLLGLVRYIHLNPIRAHLLGDLEELGGYPFAKRGGMGWGEGALGYRSRR
jgi:hypothetical protein